MRSLLIPKRVWQALGIEMRTLRNTLDYGMPSHLIRFFGGIGDDLLCTSLAREIRKRQSNAHIWILTKNRDLFGNNQDFAAVLDPGLHEHLWYSPMLRSRRINPAYTCEKHPGINAADDVSPSQHIIASMCRQAGIRGKIALKPHFILSEDEKMSGRLSDRQVVVQCIGPHSGSDMMNKLWYVERYQAVVDRLLAHKNKRNLTLIQLGSRSDPLLSGVMDLRGRTGIRQSAAILSMAECFVGTVGFLMHLARAVECRSVIIYGGREHSWQSGYSCNENLDSYRDCAPCWKWNSCDYDRQCMRDISVGDVFDAVCRALDRSGTLETDFAEV